MGDILGGVSLIQRGESKSGFIIFLDLCRPNMPIYEVYTQVLLRALIIILLYI